jgi:predicted NUDIX family phosphoesterase
MQSIKECIGETKREDEHVLVVKRAWLFEKTGEWNGLNSKVTNEVIDIIQHYKEFLPRSMMEQDPSYKQVIPYMVFHWRRNYFLMQRRSNSSEKRLSNKFTLGIGGHVRRQDMHNESIFNWAQREFEEEVFYRGLLTIQPLGILNDDSNEVGKVHIGLVLLLHGEHGDIRIKSELASGSLVPLKVCKEYADRMESWSNIILHYLV